ncbi:MAG: pyridoxine 5'-phosphate synthase [Phycisphaerae bacterium]|jgi:pyridoxine 5-phosphate synthase
MTKLSVNLNKIALLRNQRDIGVPDVLRSAETVIKAGAHGITVHPRPDERHIRYADVYELAKMTTVEFNIEGNPFLGRYMEVVSEVRPSQATLVPDTPEANTSDHGWDLKTDGKKLAPIIKNLKALGVRVSLFMDADAGGIAEAGEVGADRIELYTEPYASAFRDGEGLDEILQRCADSARVADKAGLGVNAGHDLNLDNLGKFIARVPGVLEVSIGHALIADSLEMGLYEAVKEYLKILNEKKKEI